MGGKELLNFAFGSDDWDAICWNNEKSYQSLAGGKFVTCAEGLWVRARVSMSASILY